MQSGRRRPVENCSLVEVDHLKSTVVNVDQEKCSGVDQWKSEIVWQKLKDKNTLVSRGRGELNGHFMSGFSNGADCKNNYNLK